MMYPFLIGRAVRAFVLLLAVGLLSCGEGYRSAREYLAVIEGPSPQVGLRSIVGFDIYEATLRYTPAARDVPVLVTAIADPSRRFIVRINCYYAIRNMKEERHLQGVFDALWAQMGDREKLVVAEDAPGILVHAYGLLQPLSKAERVAWIERNRPASTGVIMLCVQLTAPNTRDRLLGPGSEPVPGDN